jgi:hypothetical protein
MPRIPEDRPAAIVIEREGIEVVVGDGNDFSWAELETLRSWIDRWNGFHPDNKPITQLSRDMLRAVLAVKRVFPGAVIQGGDDELL